MKNTDSVTGVVSLASVIMALEDALVQNKNNFTDIDRRNDRSSEVYVAVENKLRELKHRIMDLPRKSHCHHSAITYTACPTKS